jgi:hypothetical protein
VIDLHLDHEMPFPPMFIDSELFAVVHLPEIFGRGGAERIDQSLQDTAREFQSLPSEFSVESFNGESDVRFCAEDIVSAVGIFNFFVRAAHKIHNSSILCSSGGGACLKKAMHTRA